MRGNLMTRRVVSNDGAAESDTDAVGGVANDPIPAFIRDSFAEKNAIFLVVNGDGGSSLDGGCDGHDLSSWGGGW